MTTKSLQKAAGKASGSHEAWGMSTKSLRKAVGSAGTYLVWVVATLITLLPIYWMFVVSARSRVELFGAPTFIQTSFFAENYIKPLSNPVFQRYMVNSIAIATSNALLVAFLAVTATYALSRWRLRGDQNIFFWTITNRMAPPAAFLLPIFLLFTRVFKIGDWSLFDTRIGLILFDCVFNLPFAIWLMKGIMDSVPIELDEAALVDGAGTPTVLLKIIVPVIAPGIAITFILSWVFAWNEYLFAATLTSVHARTITTGLAEFVTVTGTNWGEMAAVAMVSLLPALLFLTLVQRYIVAGLTFGAVKG
jgi:glycerol transport system permease protein